MLFRFLLLMTITALAELYLLMQLASMVGAGVTILLVVFTAAFGLLLAKWQGWTASLRFRQAMAAGRVPSAEIAAGLMIILAALLLLAPGLVTDAVGLVLLVPPCRKAIGRWWLTRLGRNMHLHTRVHNVWIGPDGVEQSQVESGQGETIDASFRRGPRDPDRIEE